jgi:hypothetical protein
MAVFCRSRLFPQPASRSLDGFGETGRHRPAGSAGAPDRRLRRAKMALPLLERGRGDSLPDGSARAEASRSRTVVGKRRAGRRHIARPATSNLDDGAAAARPLSGAGRAAVAAGFGGAASAPGKKSGRVGIIWRPACARLAATLLTVPQSTCIDQTATATRGSFDTPTLPRGAISAIGSPCSIMPATTILTTSSRLASASSRVSPQVAPPRSTSAGQINPSDLRPVR